MVQDSSANCFVSVVTGTGNVAGLMLGDTDDETQGRVNYDNSTSSMAFYTADAEKMRIDSSGRVIVGNTSPFTADSVTIDQGGFLAIRNTSGSGMEVRRDGTDGSLIDFQKDGSSVGSIGTLSGLLGIGNGDTGLLMAGSVDAVAPYNASTNATRDAAIDLGTATNRFKNLYLSGGVYANNASGAFLWNAENATIAFGTNNTERMRIDSSGNLLVAKTSTGIATVGVELRSDTIYSTSESIPLYLNRKGSSGTILEFRTNNGTSGTVYSTTGSVTYNTSSDYRLKENIQPLENGLERLNNLKPVKFDWKENGKSSEGFIAHEAQEVFPDAVTGEKDGEDIQGMDYGRITPLLVKAIQEQQAQIEALQSEINELKNS
jgi:hypothetical protein